MAMEKIYTLERFAQGQALWINDLHEQVSTLRGEPVPPSVLLGPSLGLENKIADD
jgi:hypothetical protein